MNSSSSGVKTCVSSAFLCSALKTLFLSILTERNGFESMIDADLVYQISVRILPSSIGGEMNHTHFSQMHISSRSAADRIGGFRRNIARLNLLKRGGFRDIIEQTFGGIS